MKVVLNQARGILGSTACINTEEENMRIGIISDTHGLLREEVLDALNGDDSVIYERILKIEGVFRSHTLRFRARCISCVRNTRVPLMLADAVRARLRFPEGDPSPCEAYRIAVCRLFFFLNGMVS